MRKTKWRILAFLLAVSVITSGMAPAMSVQAASIQQSVQTDGTSVDEETTVEESVTEESSVEEELSTEEETPEEGSSEEEIPVNTTDIPEEETLTEEEISTEEETLTEEATTEEMLPEQNRTMLYSMDEGTDDTYVGIIDTYEFDGDASGTGWSWDQETLTLTLTDATIDASTVDYYTAICLCEGSTLVSAGTANKIIVSTGDWGMDIYGSVTITGDAPLTIEGCETGIASDERASLTIDGTPITIDGEGDAAIKRMYGVSADRALLLNGGVYIATTGAQMLPSADGSYYYHSYAGSSRDDGYASDLEIKVAEDYINLDVIPAETYSGKAADAELSLTMTAQASSSTEDPVTYQWYRCDDYAHTNPVEISGATSASYTFSGSQTAGDYYFFCKATAGSMSREFPVSKVVLNTKGMLSVEDGLSIYDTTPSEDQLATYGWKWDKTTQTLTLQKAEINGELYIDIDEGDVTISLPKDSVSTVSETTSYYALTHYCDDDSNLIISGGGTLNVTRNNSSSSAYYNGVIDVDNGLVISNGAQVNVSAISISEKVLTVLQVNTKYKLRKHYLTGQRLAE